MTTQIEPLADNSAPPRPDFTPADIAKKIQRQAHEVAELKEQFFGEQGERVAECCMKMAEAFDAGGKLLVFGNGGSSSDAAHMSVECTHPIIDRRPALPAIALTTDMAMLTAIGIGLIPPARAGREGKLSIRNARPGDQLIVSGTVGDHGIAIMSVREGIEFETVLESDSPP
jgi:hypothetical protein